MLSKFRPKVPELIKYNDTADYRSMVIREIQGAFTKQQIDPDSLPDGFQAFALIGDDFFHRIAPAPHRRASATFICKEGEHLLRGRGKLGMDDCRFSEEQTFDFSDFFGHNLSIDCMIRLAEEKRQQLSPTEKTQEDRGNPSF